MKNPDGELVRITNIGPFSEVEVGRDGKGSLNTASCFVITKDLGCGNYRQLSRTFGGNTTSSIRSLSGNSGRVAYFTYSGIHVYLAMILKSRHNNEIKERAEPKICPASASRAMKVIMSHMKYTKVAQLHINLPRTPEKQKWHFLEESVNKMTVDERGGVFINYNKGAHEHEARRDENIRRSNRPYDSQRAQAVNITRKLQPDDQAISAAKLLKISKDDDEQTFMVDMIAENDADCMKAQQKAYELNDTLPYRSRQEALRSRHEALARAVTQQINATQPTEPLMFTIRAKRKPFSFGALPRVAKAPKSRGSAE